MNANPAITAGSGDSYISAELTQPQREETQRQTMEELVGDTRVESGRALPASSRAFSACAANAPKTTETAPLAAPSVRNRRENCTAHRRYEFAFEPP